MSRYQLNALWAIIFLTALNIADISMTVWALEYVPDAREFNPVMAHFIGTGGAVLIKVFAPLGVYAFAYFADSARAVRWIWILNAFYALVLAWNTAIVVASIGF